MRHGAAGPPRPAGPVGRERRRRHRGRRVQPVRPGWPPAVPPRRPPPGSGRAWFSEKRSACQRTLCACSTLPACPAPGFWFHRRVPSDMAMVLGDVPFDAAAADLVGDSGGVVSGGGPAEHVGPSPRRVPGAARAPCLLHSSGLSSLRLPPAPLSPTFLRAPAASRRLRQQHGARDTGLAGRRARAAGAAGRRRRRRRRRVGRRGRAAGGRAGQLGGAAAPL